MKKILTLVTFLFSFISSAQFLQSRLLKVEQKIWKNLCLL